MKAICPECGELVTIEPTGKRIGTWGSASYKRISEHQSESKVVAGMKIELQCVGTGRLV